MAVALTQPSESQLLYILRYLVAIVVSIDLLFLVLLLFSKYSFLEEPRKSVPILICREFGLSCLNEKAFGAHWRCYNGSVMEPRFDNASLCSSRILNGKEGSFIPLNLVDLLSKALNNDSYLLKIFLLRLEPFVVSAANDVKLSLRKFLSYQRPYAFSQQIYHIDILLMVHIAKKGEVLPMPELSKLQIFDLSHEVPQRYPHRVHDVVIRLIVLLQIVTDEIIPTEVVVRPSY